MDLKKLVYCEKEVSQLIAVKAYYDGSVFIPIEPVKAKRNQSTIITIFDENKIIENKPHLKFIGALSQESYEEIGKALADTERVDDEW